MRRRLVVVLIPLVAVFATLTASASAFHGEDARHSTFMTQLFNSPNATGATNSDLAFWGNRAYAGNYDGFRIFDISDPERSRQLVDFRCFGPQNDPIVWENKLLFLAVDRTLNAPECEATDPNAPEGDPRRLPAHDDPDGWEGVRIFDVRDPANPKLIEGVYTDCGAHTITLVPRNPRILLIYVSSYPLRPGPTCGPVRGPEVGNSPLHEKISVIRVPVNRPDRSRVIREPAISYPGDPDNRFDPDEHALAGFDDLTGCHDIGVFLELRLAAAACAEQAQMWRIKPNGFPDTEHPLWVFDDNSDIDGAGGGDVAADFWHSATFSWDGKIVNFIDESFGNGCPPVTPITPFGGGPAMPSDTGRMFFLDTDSGEKFSHFMLPRAESALNAEGEETAYCSAHLGNTVPAPDKHLLVNAWYMGGADVIDFTDPRNPFEVAFFDLNPFGPLGSDNWSAYWYEGPTETIGSPHGGLTIYATDGVHNPATGRGFQVLFADRLRDFSRLTHLNPQTQEHTFPSPTATGARTTRAGKRRARAARSARQPTVAERLAP